LDKKVNKEPTSLKIAKIDKTNWKIHIEVNKGQGDGRTK
jgi:hypothetical protein